MAANQSEKLTELCELDSQVFNSEVVLTDLQSRKATLDALHQDATAQFDVVQNSLDRMLSVKAEAQLKLDEEQVKIIERRKQITSIGGVKSAKLIERELDIGKRMIETLEHNLMQSLESVERIEKERDTLKLSLTEVEAELNSFLEVEMSQKAECENQIATLKAKREKLLAGIDQRVSTLYQRVERRYRGDAVARADNGSCRSCYRALPAQTYNQILAGYSLVQCPGCSRILIASDGMSSEQESSAA